MMGIRKDSHLSILGRFGIPPLLLGGAVTAWFAYSATANKLHLDADFWFGFALSVAITAIGVGVLLYSWWLDGFVPLRRDRG